MNSKQSDGHPDHWAKKGLSYIPYHPTTPGNCLHPTKHRHWTSARWSRNDVHIGILFAHRVHHSDKAKNAVYHFVQRKRTQLLDAFASSLAGNRISPLAKAACSASSGKYFRMKTVKFVNGKKSPRLRSSLFLEITQQCHHSLYTLSITNQKRLVGNDVRNGIPNRDVHRQ